MKAEANVFRIFLRSRLTRQKGISIMDIYGQGLAANLLQTYNEWKGLMTKMNDLWLDEIKYQPALKTVEYEDLTYDDDVFLYPLGKNDEHFPDVELLKTILSSGIRPDETFMLKLGDFAHKVKLKIDEDADIYIVPVLEEKTESPAVDALFESYSKLNDENKLRFALLCLKEIS